MKRPSNRVRVLRGLMPLGIVLAALPLATPARADRPGSTGGPVTDRRAPHPLDPALQIARDSLQHSRAYVQDYTAVLVKRLRIKGELQEHQYLFVKIRNRKVRDGQLTTPLSVYLKFLQPESVRGREVIWVEGRNAGKLIAHDTGFKNLLRVSLDPNGFLAMRNQRYPISDIGMENLVAKLIETAERDRRYGECDVRFFQNAKVGDRICRMVQVIHPVRRSHFDFYCARVYFDAELNLPIRYASWSWPPPAGGQPLLEEEYTYTNVEVNVGLTDRDFDPDNSAYAFP